MSKTFKDTQRAKFMHGLLSYKDVCLGLKKRWNKMNFNWGRYKKKKLTQTEKEIDKQANIDLEEQSHT